MSGRPDREPAVSVFVVVLAVAGVVGLVVMSAIVIVPYFVATQYKPLRNEVPSNVDGIKTALLGYDAAFDTFVPCAVAPRFVHELDEQKVPWTSPPDFEQLGWTPDGDVRGTYWVEVSADGREFEVHGKIDADGDGIPQHYRATRTTNAILLTPNDVY